MKINNHHIDSNKEILNSLLHNNLFDKIILFATKFDLSLIDEDTQYQLESVLEKYGDNNKPYSPYYMEGMAIMVSDFN